MYALKLYKNGKHIKTLTTRTGLSVENGKIKSDLKEYNGYDYELFDIMEQKTVGKGVIGKDKEAKDGK